MPLRYLWARSPCQRPARSPSSPREDASEAPVGKVAVPKTVQKPPSPRGDGSEVLVGMVAVPKTGQKPPSPRDNLYPMGPVRFPCARDPQASRSLPLSAAIDLREIHLARQSSLQVPVGHIPVPGGIKLCSPGTFLVANYLIINNSSCQVNFTKPNSATFRSTNSQWLREDATEVLVGMVVVPKTGQKTASPRDNLNSMGTTCFPCAREHSLSESSAVHCHRTS